MVGTIQSREEKLVRKVTDAVKESYDSANAILLIIAQQELNHDQRSLLLRYASDLRSSYSKEHNSMLPRSRDREFESERESMGEKTIDYLVEAGKVKTPISQERLRALSYRSF